MDLEDMILWVFAIAFVIANILLFQGHFIDLAIERQAADVPRAAINLLNSISSSSKLLVTDARNFPTKNSFDVAKLLNPPKSNCCDSLQYDYLLKITNLEKNENDDLRNFYISNIQSNPQTPLKTDENKFLDFGRLSQCYPGSRQMLTASAERFVNVCEGSNCDLGVASIEIAETPLSQVAFWITRACNEQQNFVKKILIDKNDIRFSSIVIDTDPEKNQVCVRRSGSEVEICKKYSCEPKTFVGQERLKELETFVAEPSCFVVQVQKTDRGAYISLPPFVEPPKLIEPIPKDRDAWTEKTALKFKPEKKIFGFEVPYPLDLIASDCTKVSDDSSTFYRELRAGTSSIRFDKFPEGCGVTIKFSEFNLEFNQVDGTFYNKLNFAFKGDGKTDYIVLGVVLNDGSKNCEIFRRYANLQIWDRKTLELDKLKDFQGDPLRGVVFDSYKCDNGFKMSQIQSIKFTLSGLLLGTRSGLDNIWIDNLHFSR